MLCASVAKEGTVRRLHGDRTSGPPELKQCGHTFGVLTVVVKHPSLSLSLSLSLSPLE